MPAFAPAEVLVVGDTPHDVACAQAVGAVAGGGATRGVFCRPAARLWRRCCLRDAGGYGGFWALVVAVLSKSLWLPPSGGTVKSRCGFRL
jgi:hypothetical protein